jgi:hypothetical protein
VGDTQLLDALFVGRDEAGTLIAVDRAVGLAGGSFAALLDFRLEPAQREALTARTLAEHAGGVPGSLIEAIGDGLEPGTAIFVVLRTGPAAQVLDEAVARVNGEQVLDEPVEARALVDLVERLHAAVAPES